MSNESAWWTIVRSLLVNDWGYNRQYLTLSTPLFEDNPAKWMDYVEIIQEATDTLKIPCPSVPISRAQRFQTIGDVVDFLDQWAPVNNGF